MLLPHSFTIVFPGNEHSFLSGRRMIRHNFEDRLDLPKSHLIFTRQLSWIGLHWNSISQTVSLSEENRCWKVFLSIHAKSRSRRQSESLLGPLNYAAELMKLGRLRLRRIIFEGRSFLMEDRDHLVWFPHHLKCLPDGYRTTNKNQ